MVKFIEKRKEAHTTPSSIYHTKNIYTRINQLKNIQNMFASIESLTNLNSTIHNHQENVIVKLNLQSCKLVRKKQVNRAISLLNKAIYSIDHDKQLFFSNKKRKLLKAITLILFLPFSGIDIETLALVLILSYPYTLNISSITSISLETSCR